MKAPTIDEAMQRPEWFCGYCEKKIKEHTRDQLIEHKKLYRERLWGLLCFYRSMDKPLKFGLTPDYVREQEHRMANLIEEMKP